MQNWRYQAASPQLQKASALPFLQSLFGKILVLFFLDLLLLSFNRLCPTVLQAQAPHGIASPRHSTINIDNLPLPCKTNNAIIAAWAGISENRSFPLLLQPSFYMLLDSTCLSVLGSTALVSIASHCLQFAVINSACFSAAARCSSAIRARFCAGMAAGTTDSTMKYCDIRHLWSTVKFHHIKSFSMRSFTSDDMRSIALDSLLWASSASLCLLSSAAILSALIFRLEVQECGLNDLIWLDSSWFSKSSAKCLPASRRFLSSSRALSCRACSAGSVGRRVSFASAWRRRQAIHVSTTRHVSSQIREQVANG